MCWEPFAASREPSRQLPHSYTVLGISRSENPKEVTAWQGAAPLTAAQGISQPDKVRLFQIHANSESDLSDLNS